MPRVCQRGLGRVRAAAAFCENKKIYVSSTLRRVKCIQPIGCELEPKLRQFQWFPDARTVLRLHCPRTDHGYFVNCRP